MNATPAERAAESTWTKLRRRKVVQWGIAYAAGAWLLMQVLEYFSGTYDWPRQLQQLTTLALLIGLPIVLVLAWYHGDRGQQRITTPEFAILTLLLLLGGGAFWYYQRTSETATVATPPSPTEVATATDRSIAVLPFVNMSGDADDEYFSDGITEELLNRLTLIPELQVTARTSSFRFKGKAEDVKTIGESLGVRHVLEGSVRRQGDRIRVTAQLVNAENGYRIWANTFDKRLEDVFAIQDEIAQALADNLELTLLAETRAVLARRGTRNAQALDLYLRARHLYQSWDLQRINKAIEYFDEVIRLDPAFVAAYVSQAEALFARSHVTMECCNPESPDAARRRDLLRRALELDSENADAIASIGRELMFARDFERAARELHRAEAINPNGEHVLRNLVLYSNWVGWPPERASDYANRLFRLDPLNPLAAREVVVTYLYVHQYEKALSAADKALELDPNAWLVHWLRGVALVELGRQGDAQVAIRRALALNPHFTDAYADLVDSYVRAGRMDEAQKLFAQIDDPGYKPPWRPAFRAWALASLGRYDEATTALEQAYEANDGILPEALAYPAFIPMHDNPRFQRLVRLLKVERRVQYTRDMIEARRSRQKQE